MKASPHRTHGHGEVQESRKRSHVLAQYEQSVEDIVSNYPACTEHQRSNPKEPMTAHDLPQRPWQNVAICSCLRMNSI